MLYIYGQFNSVAELQNRYKLAHSTGDLTSFTDEDKHKLIEELTSISSDWQWIIYFTMVYVSFPLALFNKFVYTRLTERPFIWLPHYSADILTVVLLYYTLYKHFQWINEENPGLYLQDEPSQELMYFHAYTEHVLD